LEIWIALNFLAEFIEYHYYFDNKAKLPKPKNKSSKHFYNIIKWIKGCRQIINLLDMNLMWKVDTTMHYLKGEFKEILNESSITSVSETQ